MKGHTYLYFINARTHGKITRQWKSALKEACFSVNIVGGAARGMKGGAKKDSAPHHRPPTRALGFFISNASKISSRL